MEVGMGREEIQDCWKKFIHIPNAARFTMSGHGSDTGLIVPPGLGLTVIEEFGPAHNADVGIVKREELGLLPTMIRD
jgi:hypothetical protein